MNQMTRQELDDRLLDYLYDELEPSQRTAFERALAAHPEVVKEVEAHRATRRAYQALPREAAPVGLLADVLAAADLEAAKRSAAATAATPIGLWERLRRVLFQPAFAMAMVVMVVAGVSLVGTRKAEMPNMTEASDAQHLPPVAVNEARSRAARSEAPAAASVQAEGVVGSAGMAAALDEELAADPAPPPIAAPVAPTPDVAALAAREASKGGVRGPEPKLDAFEPAKAPVVATAPASKNGDAAGYADDLKKAMGPARPADKVAAGLVDGELMNGVATGNEDELARDQADPASRRDANVVDPAPRLAVETETVPQPRTEAPPTDERQRLEEKAKTVKPAEASKSPEPAPAPTQPERRVDSPKLATKDVESDRGGTTPTPKEEVAEVKRSEGREVTVADQGRAATPDDADSTTDKKPATLTPPAPSSDKLWSTYQQQTAAGAFADALRSIDALAKVEGETSRVKQARAELKKRLEPTPVPAGANKLPPDPPVQPPK